MNQTHQWVVVVVVVVVVEEEGVVVVVAVAAGWWGWCWCVHVCRGRTSRVCHRGPLYPYND
jgi:hypothetical protein